MAATIPDSHQDLLTAEKKAFAVLATIGPDQTPQGTPVWFDVHDGKYRVNTAAGRIKHRNMTKNAAVALVILDPANPYRYLQVRGNVTAITEEGADAHIDSLAMKYMGQEKYPFRKEGEQRVIFEITPGSFQHMG